MHTKYDSYSTEFATQLSPHFQLNVHSMRIKISTADKDFSSVPTPFVTKISNHH